MQKHWIKLTLFLREPGAPLDNNICTAARGSADIMPTPGLCRLGMFPAPPEVLFDAYWRGIIRMVS
jgi:hypothetical protein